LFTNFHHIWQEAAAINVDIVCRLSTSPDICTYTNL